MGDYLGNLAVKSLGQAEVVRPRPVSWFEPLPLASGLSSEHLSGLEADDGPVMLDAPVVPSHPLAEQLLTTAPGQQRPDDLVDPGWRFRPSADRRPLAPGASPPTREGAPPLPARQAPGEEQPAGQSAAPSAAAFPPVETRRAPPPAQPAPEPAAQSSTAPSSVEQGTDQPLLPPAAAFQPVETRRVPPPAQPAPGLMPRPRETQLSPESLPWSSVLDHSRLLLATTGDETDAAPLRSVAERRVGRRPLEPVIRQLVIERAIPPPVPAPAEAASAKRSVVERESPTALGPLVQQTAIEQTVAPAAPPSFPVERVATPQEPRPATVVAQPQVRAAPRVEPLPAAPVKPAPTIQVTIGRVEVRATPPPAPAPRKQRPKPAVMSLDEYLHQRANGGDR